MINGIAPFAWILLGEIGAPPRHSDDLLVAIGWTAPALFWVIALAGGPPLMPLLLAALMLLVCRRVVPKMASPVPEPVGKVA